MRKMMLIAGLIAGVAAAPTRASAGIVCDGDYQVVNGMSVATPYCESENLANNARRHGVNVSGKSVRSNEDVRISACNEPGASEGACSDLVY